MDALRTFLQCKGSVSALFMDTFEIRPRPFPLSPSGSEPNEEDQNVTVFAQPFYLSEHTSSAVDPIVPLRVRIQVGGDEDEEGEGQWKELPSLLHMDILQLLQPDPSSASESTGDLLVSDLYEILQELKGGEVSWGDVRDALRWLYEETMVHFEGSIVIGSTAEKGSLERLFGEGVTITDLR